MLRPAGCLLAVLAVPAATLAQGPAADWRTLTTPHFRVHYTAPAEAWSERAAARLEAIRERVIAEVGYEPREVVDVVVADPIAQSNGAALPLLGWPRLVLWTTPPSPGSGLGDYTEWGDLLVVHEETHLVHLLRPSRSPLERVVEALLPLGPIALRAPRWIHEGYATLVEGRLTASGRPNGDLRAAILRQRARAGKLPTYKEMANDAQSWFGMSMAYLAGSAYLEWLVERGGPDSLKHLWTRLTARADRSFDAAFEGVYGESPQRLYGRFCAELTWRAMEAERRLDPVKREGELWQDLRWTTGEPAVSRDGKQLVIVLRDRRKPSRMVIWPTAPDEKAAREWRERAENLLSRDPGDVAAVRSKPLARKPLYELVTRDGAEPFTPRFIGDGRSVLFERFEPDRNGFLHPDLFRWTSEDGGVVRVTRLADVREADPAPDGTWAVAVRHRNGLSQLVRVDLASGGVTEVTGPSLDLVYAAPRIAPDGRRIVFVRHQQGAWGLVVLDLATRRETRLPAPAGSLVAYPAWSADGSRVFASMGRNGFVDVVAFEPAGGATMHVTATIGAALAPAPSPDGSGLYFLSLQAEGLSLRHIELTSVPLAASGAELSTELAPAVRPLPPPLLPPFASAKVGSGRPYGFGRQELMPLVGGVIAPSGHSVELGLRVGDVVGRLDAFALGAIGGAGGPQGGTVAATWRGWPVAVGLQGYDSKEQPSRQALGVPGLGTGLDLERRGVVLTADWRRQWRVTALDLRGGALAGEVRPAGGDAVSERAGFVEAVIHHTPTLGQWGFPEGLAANFTSGRGGGGTWRHYGGSAELGVTRGGNGLLLAWHRESARDARNDFDRLQLGGTTTTLLPAEAAGGRIPVAALPAGTRIGDDYEGQSVVLHLRGLPLFYSRYAIWSPPAPRGEWLRMAGLEWDLGSDPLPIVRLPGVHLTVGVARILDEPFEGSTRAWLGVAWKP